jgi:hypothetical protein
MTSLDRCVWVLGECLPDCPSCEYLDKKIREDAIRETTQQETR